MTFFAGRHAQNFQFQELKKFLVRKNLTHFVHLEILVNKIKPNALTDKPVIIKPVSRIKPTLRLFQALEDAPNYQIFSKLLSPDLSSFYLRSGNEAPKYPTELMFGNLNAEQKKIMSACASMCTSNMATPQAAIIQGKEATVGKMAKKMAKKISHYNFCCFLKFTFFEQPTCKPSNWSELQISTFYIALADASQT